MNEKAKTVHEVAKLTGITARTLHYYDEIGLLKPSIITEAKYRQYTDDDLTRLQSTEIKKLNFLHFQMQKYLSYNRNFKKKY